MNTLIVTIMVMQFFAEPCDLFTINCGATYAADFMPASGRLVAGEDSSVGGRFLFVAFRWNSPDRMVAFQADPWRWKYPTLEPDVLYESDDYAYITRINQALYLEPTITSYKKLPCSYIDTPISDDSPKPTIGCGCPEKLKVNELYYSFATGESGAAKSSVGLRFQLGMWFPSDICLFSGGYILI